ncbi:MAG: acetylornithine deacetylase [Flavobacteriales bacterium CG03_land_8_20_14_0_80_35_15]|nr:MAG: acetylornithine deacetylase [Flavobacteriales bacterium CG03_land_8_20_14_0_80_35_15]
MKTAQNILKDLVGFPVLGGQSNLDIINYIKDVLTKHQITYHLVPNTEGTKASIFCRIGPAVDGGFILSGHTDVVPVAGQAWLTDPFILTEKPDGKLYGRGSCDMKGFIACCLVNLTKMTSVQLKKPIYFAFSYDEEIGCVGAPDLIKSLLKTYAEKPKYALIGEPTLMQPIVGQKGICVFKTTVYGSEGHSSRIKQEVSAIHEAAKLVVWLEQKMDTLIAEKHIDKRFNPPHSSIHIGKINGGVAPNVIANECTFYWDVRIIPQDHIETIKNDFLDYCQSRIKIMRKINPKFNITLTADHPAVPALDTPENRSIVSIIKQLSCRSDLGTVAYAAEAGQFSNAGLEAVICGPGSIEQAHRANEFISKEELKKGEKMIADLVDYLS